MSSAAASEGSVSLGEMLISVASVGRTQTPRGGSSHVLTRNKGEQTLNKNVCTLLADVGKAACDNSPQVCDCVLL